MKGVVTCLRDWTCPYHLLRQPSYNQHCLARPEHAHWNEALLLWAIRCWWAAKELPAKAVHIVSPYDTDARYSKNHTTEWTGYLVHLTETCADDAPHLITTVQTVSATTHDATVLLVHVSAAPRIIHISVLLVAGALDFSPAYRMRRAFFNSLTTHACSRGARRSLQHG